jgi:hypothetical protein
MKSDRWACYYLQCTNSVHIFTWYLVYEIAAASSAQIQQRSLLLSARTQIHTHTRDLFYSFFPSLFLSFHLCSIFLYFILSHLFLPLFLLYFCRFVSFHLHLCFLYFITSCFFLFHFSFIFVPLSSFYPFTVLHRPLFLLFSHKDLKQTLLPTQRSTTCKVYLSN